MRLAAFCLFNCLFNVRKTILFCSGPVVPAFQIVALHNKPDLLLITEREVVPAFQIVALHNPCAAVMAQGL